MAESGQIDKVRVMMERAVDRLKAAQDCLNEEKYIEGVSNKAYWAAYYSLEAVAWFYGKRIPEDYALFAFLNRELIRTGLMNEDIEQKFRQLYRQSLLDYSEVKTGSEYDKP